MSLVSVIDHHKLSYLLTVEFKNPIIKTYEKFFDEAFSHKILPTPTKSTLKFTEDQAPLYLNREYHEELHLTFWNHESDRKKVVAITGDVGSGKSTLIEFYLRCYCPRDPKVRDKFKQKLIIHIDCEGLKTGSDLEYMFWKRSYERVKQSVEYYEELAQRLNFVSIDRCLTYRERTEKLLEQLSALLDVQKKHYGFQFEYIVLVVDNLDRSPIEVQTLALVAIKSWIEFPSTIQLWQVYLPLWPETLARLRVTESLALDKKDLKKIAIKTLDAKEVMPHRVNTLQENIQKGERHPAANAFSAQDVCRHLSEAIGLVRIELFDFSSDLVGGNMRKCIDMWEGILSSQTLYHYRGRPRITDYQFYDALIVGAYPVFKNTTSQIINVLNCLGDSEDERDLLIGVHILYLLGMKKEVTCESIVKQMQCLGYDAVKVNRVVSQFASRNLFHAVPSADGVDAILVHPRAIKAYKKLVSEAAYLDNMAIVTPMDEERIAKQGLVRTKGFETDQFHDRVECTCAFLEFIGDQEMQFLVQGKAGKASGNSDSFRDVLQRTKMPSVANRLGYGYKLRLEALRTHPTYLKDAKDVSDNWWMQMLSKAIIANSSQDDVLLISLYDRLP